MPREADAALQAKILQVGFVLVFLAAILYGVRGMMFGSGMVVKLTALGIIGSAIVIALDDRYWLFPAFLFGYQDTLPVVKFTGMELGSIVLFTTFFVRLALRRDAFVASSKRLPWAAVPFLAWMCLVWGMNPVGMNIFGSSTIGGRFYLKVILAFLSLVCFCSIRVDDRNSKWILFVYLAGIGAKIARRLLFGELDEAMAAGTTHYQFADCGYLAAFFLCRYAAAEILVRTWPFLGFFATFLLTVYSGNRHMFAFPVLVGASVPFILRRDRLRTCALAGMAFVCLLVVVAGHGSLWRLPFSVQRSLSFLPGRWDYRLNAYGLHDNFRATLRMYAREHIAERPWFGDGGFSLDYSEMDWVTGSEFNHRGDMYSGHVLSRNWHNVWLGMAADFGIPFSVAWALFTGVLLFSGFRWVRTAPPGSWSQTAETYFYAMILVTWVDFFFNGGHSAKTPERFFVWAGLLCAIANGHLRKKQLPAEAC